MSVAAKRFLMLLTAFLLFCGVNLTSRYLNVKLDEAEQHERDNTAKLISPPYMTTVKDFTKQIDSFKVGDVIVIHNSYKRESKCDYHIHVDLLPYDTEHGLSTTLSDFSNWRAEGVVSINEPFKIPDFWIPGHYHVIKKVINYCSEGTFYATIYDIPLNVVDKHGR